MFKFNESNKIKDNKRKVIVNLIELFVVLAIVCMTVPFIKDIFAYFTHYTNAIVNNFTAATQRQVTYNFNLLDDNSTLDDPLTEDVDVGDTVTLDSSKIIDDASYTFVNFEINGTEYDLDDEFVMPNADVTVDEYYVRNNSITYVLNGGTNDANNPSSYTMLDTINLASPTRTDYIFDGWYENSGFTGSATTTITNRTGDITLYAKWTKTEFKVTVHYYEEGTQDQLAPDVVLTSNVLGASYTTSSIADTDRYYYVSTVGNATGTYTMEDIVVTYYYRVRTFEITGDAGVGGIIEGADETVRYGEDSVNDIVITPDIGKKVDTIEINGVELEDYVENKTTRVVQLDKFINVTEDKEIEVTFTPITMVAKIIAIPAGYDDLLPAEEKLLNKEFEFLEYAIQAIPTNTEGFVIQMIDDTREDNIIVNKLIKLDLNGHEIKSFSETNPTFKIQSGSLQVIDSAYTGKITNKKGTGIRIESSGTFTLGEDDGTIGYLSPIIYGKQKGVVSLGTFNFYDGRIRGQVAIDGRADDTPALYDPSNDQVTINGENLRESILAIVSNYEALIGKTRYTLLEDAVYAANNIKGTSLDEIEIDIVKDLSKNATVTMDNTKNIILDLNGHTFTTSASTPTIENSGKLQIIDSSYVPASGGNAEVLGTGSISSSTGVAIKTQGSSELTVLNGQISTTVNSTTSSAILGAGTSQITIGGKANVSNSKGYGVQTTEQSEFIMDGGTITTDTGSCVYHNGTGDVEINGGSIVISTTGNGVENNSTGEITIGSCTITDNNTSSKSGYAVRNNNNSGLITIEPSCQITLGNKKEMIYCALGTINITGGTFSQTNNNLIYVSKSSSNSGTVNVTGGSFTIASGYLVQSSGNTNITGGTYSFSGTSEIIKNTGTMRIEDVTFSSANGIANQTSNANLTLKNVTMSTTGNYSTIKNANYNSGDSATLTIEGGTYSTTYSNTSVITNSNNGTVTLKSGTFTSTTGTTISNNTVNNTLTIGVKNDELDDTVEISGGNTTNPTVKNNGEFNFYGGTITGKITILGEVTEIEDDSYIDIYTQGSNKVAELKLTDYIAEVTNASLTNDRCKTLQEAVTKCGTDSTSVIKITKDINIDESSKALIGSSQNLTINLNGYTITAYTQTGVINNEGTVTLTDLTSTKKGTITLIGKSAVYNSGTLTIEKIKITESNAGISSSVNNVLVTNAGTLTVNSGNLETSSQYLYDIYNTGTGDININGGTIKTTRAANTVIYSDSTGTITMTAGTLSSSSTSTSNYVIDNHSSGTVTVTGGTISTSSNKGTAIYNESGTVELQAGLNSSTPTINGTVQNKTGSITMSAGTVTGYNYGLYNSGSGTITVTGGSVSGSNTSSGYGINNTSSGTIIVGEKGDPPPSISSPSIYGGKWGVKNGTNGTFKFFDGVLEGKSGYSYEGIITEYELGYAYHRFTSSDANYGITVTSGREKTILIQKNIARLASNNIKYKSIEEALADATATDTITMIDNSSLTESANQIIVNKNITLDLAGYTIEVSKANAFEINGTLEITDSSVGGTGVINTSKTVLFDNQSGATLTLTGGTINLTTGGTSSTYKELILNEGNVIVQGATVNANSRSYTNVISNSSAGNITVSSGTLNGSGMYNTVIYSNSTGTINISGGTIAGLTNAIETFDSETINITGGSFTKGSSSNYIYIHNAGEVYVSGQSTYIGPTVYILDDSYLEVTNGTFDRVVYISYNEASKNATCEINNGNFKSIIVNSNNQDSLIINGGTFEEINNNGTGDIIIDSATITQTSSNAVAITNSAGTMTISNTTITQSTGTTGKGIQVNNSATVEFQSGSINAAGYGIYNNSTGTIILGEQGGSVSNITPSITATGNIGIYNANGTLKIYDGVVQGSGSALDGMALDGIVTEIETNTVLSLTKQNNVETAILISNAKVAKIGAVEYDTLQDAVDACSNGVNTEIDIISNFALIEPESVIVPAGKDILLDLSGYTITSLCSNSTITNNGTLAIKQDNVGTIMSRANSIFTNNGTMIINGGNFNNNGKTAYILQNTGTCTINGGTFGTAQNIIQNTGSTATLTIAGGTITATNKLIDNTSGTIRITGGTITNSSDENISTISNTGGTFEISGGSITSARPFENTGTLAISNLADIEFTYQNAYIDNKNNGSIQISGGEITSVKNIIGLKNSSSLTITAGTLESEGSAIYINTYRINPTVNISGGTIISNTGNAIYSNSQLGYGTITITGGTLESTTSTAIFSKTGTLTLGTNDIGGIPSVLVPEINGYIYGVDSEGTFNFYDGVITGQTQPISGVVTNKPDGYTVVLGDNNTKATLGIVAQVDNTIELNGIYYTSLASAITAINGFESHTGVIKLNGSVQLQSQLTIPSGANVTLALQGHAITYDNAQTAIVNNGTLTVVDFEDNTESLDPGEESIIRNNIGTAIQNNGTLTLGASGGQTNANSPVISGGVTGNAPTIYDGKVVNN